MSGALLSSNPFSTYLLQPKKPRSSLSVPCRTRFFCRPLPRPRPLDVPRNCLLSRRRPSRMKRSLRMV